MNSLGEVQLTKVDHYNPRLQASQVVGMCDNLFQPHFSSTEMNAINKTRPTLSREGSQHAESKHHYSSSRCSHRKLVRYPANL